MQNGGKMLKIFRTGYCVAREKIAYRIGSWKRVKFHSRIFVLETDMGNILIDAGYSKKYNESRTSFLNRMYHLLIPANPRKSKSIKELLKEQDVCLEDISYVMITHFHIDHICGLDELRSIPWIVREDIWRDLLTMNPVVKVIKHGVFENILPKKLPKGSLLISDKDFHMGDKTSTLRFVRPFPHSSIELIDLPGHALGQMGLSYENQLFIGDAIWCEEALNQRALPNRLGLFLQHDKKQYLKTFQALLDLKKRTPSLKIIPTHMMEKL